MDFKPGMLLAFNMESDTYGVCKVTGITETSKEPIISVVTYADSFDSVPEEVNPAELRPLVIHMPMYLPALKSSNCKEIGMAEITEDEARGFDNWLLAWKDRRAGFFERSIPDSIDYILEQMANVENSTPEDSVFRERLMRRFQGQ